MQDRANTAERKLTDHTHIMAELTQKVRVLLIITLLELINPCLICIMRKAIKVFRFLNQAQNHALFFLPPPILLAY